MSQEGDMDFERLDPAERLLAEQAVLAFREVKKTMRAAPHGRGLEVTEQATLVQGRRQMMRMLEEALKAQAAAEKGGPRANADAEPRTATRPASSW